MARPMPATTPKTHHVTGRLPSGEVQPEPGNDRLRLDLFDFHESRIWWLQPPIGHRID
jgi:hypothetical protein